jgi:DnaJ-class molecular chaperone
VASLVTFEAWAESLANQDYYRILRVPQDATPAQIKEAFHALALRCHPDRYAGEDPELVAAAARVFKCASEAYAVLSKEQRRSAYNEQLKQGEKRMLEGTKVKAKAAAETISDMAQTGDGKVHAARADHWLRAREFEKVRIELINACNAEPFNERLKTALKQFYEAWARM